MSTSYNHCMLVPDSSYP
uniref:Uncharacterized protein n=1 Tax=Anguilla anguilla TaxID=7936 RepID=A0A0E9PHL5_ANGAN